MKFRNYEEIFCRIISMDREEIIDQILHFEGHLKLDFTEQYLRGLTDDQLRHILQAAEITELLRQTV